MQSYLKKRREYARKFYANLSPKAKEQYLEKQREYKMKLFENIKKVIKEDVRKPLKITTCFDHFDEMKAKWRERGCR